MDYARIVGDVYQPCCSIVLSNSYVVDCRVLHLLRW